MLSSYNVHHVTFLVWSVSMLTFNGNVIAIPSTMLLGPLKKSILKCLQISILLEPWRNLRDRYLYKFRLRLNHAKCKEREKRILYTLFCRWIDKYIDG